MTILIAIFCGRLAQRFNNYIRHIHNLRADALQQNYWSEDNSQWWPWLKKNLLYAPIGKKRHHRELQVSKAVNIGTLPSRLHGVLLGAYYLMNLIGCLMLDWSAPGAVRWAALRGRSGYLAVWNMLLLMVCMARTNPLISTLKISYDTFNLFHRWLGRLVALEVVVHMLAWFINAVRGFGIHGVQKHVSESAFLIYGFLGTIAMTIMVIHSVSFIRHGFWEIFLASHQILAVLAFIGTYQHLKLGTPPALLKFFNLVIEIWVIERAGRAASLVYRNIGLRSWKTKVLVQALPGVESACRVTFQLQRTWKNEPGTHAYIYLPGISMWMSHPFSIAWYDKTSTDFEKQDLPFSISDTNGLPPRTANNISMIIATRSGMTKQLFDKASAAPGGQILLNGYLEGPYGGPMSLKSYGTVLLFAGGVGITHQLPYVRDLVAGYELGKVATRKIVLVWSVRYHEQLEWIRPWMNQILEMPGRKDVLEVSIFVTKPRNPRDIVSHSQKVRMYNGRLNSRQIIAREVQDRVGAMAVTVCGPGALADDIREGVRAHIDEGTIDFQEESFTW